MSTNSKTTTSVLHNAIMETDGKNRPLMLAPTIAATDDAPAQRESQMMGTYATVGEDIKERIDVDAEVVHIILTGNDNDIYSIVMHVPMPRICGKQLNV
uniref:Uncharacterized protein n=1 Tax=Tanacetum cinerariifolium TaxID=118510 RepID=A0A6L2LN84_TANCI|nr:hypothetical protein [Tanacetum cinerariifolium]